MTELSVEATGETVGEAKWSALRDLERKRPGLDKTAVRFQVVSEGERGLLGVGYEPARVVASIEDDHVAEPVASPAPAGEDETADGARLRELVERIAHELGINTRIAISETDEELRATCDGAELGMLIGKHGQTIDAIQYLGSAILYRGRYDERKRIVVDAAGYRARRQVTLDALALRLAEQASATGQRVELEPMTAVERKIVHERLKDDPEIETLSEGTEPNRYVVILPRNVSVPRSPLLFVCTRRHSGLPPGRARLRAHRERPTSDVLERWLGPSSRRGTHGAEGSEAGASCSTTRWRAWSSCAASRGRSSTSARAGARRGSRWRPRCRERSVTLLEAERRKTEFLERWTTDLPNLRVVWGRAETQTTDCYKVAVAKALAHPPVAAEWCLPLVEEGGVVILWVGPSADPERVARVAKRVEASSWRVRPGSSSCERLGRRRRAFLAAQAWPRSVRSPSEAPLCSPSPFVRVARTVSTS